MAISILCSIFPPNVFHFSNISFVWQALHRLHLLRLRCSDVCSLHQH
jgi:hypothetical protein